MLRGSYSYTSVYMEERNVKHSWFAFDKEVIQATSGPPSELKVIR